MRYDKPFAFTQNTPEQLVVGFASRNGRFFTVIYIMQIAASFKFFVRCQCATVSFYGHTTPADGVLSVIAVLAVL